jgi:hypothetical protein
MCIDYWLTEKNINNTTISSLSMTALEGCDVYLGAIVYNPFKLNYEFVSISVSWEFESSDHYLLASMP